MFIRFACPHPAGKSSLIAAATQGSVPSRLPKVLPPSFVSADELAEGVGMLIHDTPSLSDPASRDEILTRCAESDVLVLCFSSESPASVHRLHSIWMPFLRSSGLKVPVVLVGLRQDLQDTRAPTDLPGGGNLEAAVTPLMRQYAEIESCLACSALRMQNVDEVFFFAVKVVLHPLGPLWDTDVGLTPKCRAAMLNIFRQCDRDADGLLSDDELNTFQIKCFGAPLGLEELDALKDLIQARVPTALSPAPARFVTQTGWLALHALSIERGRNETAWTVLREFGYDLDLTLSDEALALPSEYLTAAAMNTPRDLVQLASRPVAADPAAAHPTFSAAIELTEDAVRFLSSRFDAYDRDRDGFVTDDDMEAMFVTAPRARPFDEDPAWSAAKIQGLVPGHGLNKQGFLALWSSLALWNPRTCWAHLVYLGFPLEVGPQAVLRLCARRGPGRPPTPCTHPSGLIRVGMLGPRGAGKTTLLYTLLGPASGGERDLELLVRGTRVAAIVKALAPLPSGPPALRTLALEELSAEDNRFLEEHDAAGAALASTDGASTSLWGLADAFRSLLGGAHARPRALATGTALAQRFDVLLVAFDSQSLASARAALATAAVCQDACRGEVPLRLIGCKGDLGPPSPEVVECVRMGCQATGVRGPLLICLDDGAAEGAGEGRASPSGLPLPAGGARSASVQALLTWIMGSEP